MEDSTTWAVLDKDFNIDFVESPNPWLTNPAVAQDQRSKNRFREHTQVGHELKVQDPEARALAYPDHRLYSCSCKWLGWLIPKEQQ